MRMPKPEYLIGGAVLLAGLYMWTRGAKGAAQDVGEAVSGAIVGAADGVLTGTVTGVGQVVGIPKTNMTACEKAMAEGRTWDASFDCPAGTWLKYIWD